MQVGRVENIERSNNYCIGSRCFILSYNDMEIDENKPVD